MTRFELLRKIYNSLDDGNGILDFSLEGENSLVVWTEDGNKFILSIEEESEEQVMSLINELRERSEDANNVKQEVIEEIKKYFYEYLQGEQLEHFLRKSISDSDIKKRKKFIQIKFWEYHAGCSDTYFYCSGLYWENPENKHGIKSWEYKGVKLKDIQDEICEYLTKTLIDRMEQLGFHIVSNEYKPNRLGYYERYFYFGW